MRRIGWRRRWVVAGLALVTFHVSRFTLPPSHLGLPTAQAAPTQEEVFKSIQDNVGDSSVDWGKVLPFVLAGGGVVLLAVVVGQLRNRTAGRPGRARGMNHPGKLMKEVLRIVPLRPAEVRQLKLLAADAAGGDAPVGNPLTLVLCPSVLAKAIQARQRRGAKVDRKVVGHLARKVGLTREMLAGTGTKA